MNDALGALPKVGLCLTPVAAAHLPQAAVVAEQLGYESLWLGEHHAPPVHWGSMHPGGKAPFDARSEFVEPFVALAHIAALTSVVRLGTGAILTPLRDPFLTARAIATLDVLSGGRLEVGVVAGWLREEFEVMGKDFSTRGRVHEEFLAVLDALFSEEAPEHHGDFFDFPQIGFEPKPLQRPRPPVVVGGITDAALRRAARLGDGWITSAGLPVAGVGERVSFLRAELMRAGRDAEAFEVSVLQLRSVSREDLEALAEQGVQRVIVAPWGSVEQLATPGTYSSLEPLEQYAREVGLTPRMTGLAGSHAR